ncbi:hypothetical protein EVAR_23238_1 [Eumeta japonica]|uniref:Uncharacterized protein n=1 Tax=Eumeta variegata TaxID=151549 RepID=A0A4C1VGT1_EUMVA|nr:hypothetical protein EVAR_23238_1 [Eumeta japonica]
MNSIINELCAAAVSLLLGRIGRWTVREIARSALSLARSAQAERDNKSYFVRTVADVGGDRPAKYLDGRAVVKWARGSALGPPAAHKQA